MNTPETQCCTDIFTEDTEFRRDLGPVEAVSIVIGRIIGSGIFRTPGPIMALVGCTSLFGLVWVLGGLITIFGAVCYAELVAMMPKSGGPYVYLKAAYGPLWSFLRGWAMFFVAETGAIAAVALVFAEYSHALYRIITGLSFPEVVVFGYPCPQLVVLLIAFATIWTLTSINLFGVFLSGVFQNIFSTIKIVAVSGIIVVAVSSTKGSSHSFMNPLWPADFSWSSILAVGAALRYSFFAFSGWEGATYVAEEVRNPRRNLPLSLFLGITGVMFLYAGANGAYLYLLPPATIAASNWVATEAMNVAVGATGGILISAAVMLNTFGNVSTQILCKARTWQAMAADGLFFRAMGKIHPRYKTPNRSLIAQGLWASVLLIFAAFAESSYEAIIDFFSATGIIFNIMTFASVIIFRKKFPDMSRPYKAWFYPWSVVLIVGFYFIYLAITLVTAFVPSVLGLLLTSTGLVYYYFFARPHRENYPRSD